MLLFNGSNQYGKAFILDTSIHPMLLLNNNLYFWKLLSYNDFIRILHMMSEGYVVGRGMSSAKNITCRDWRCCGHRKHSLTRINRINYTSVIRDT